MIIVSQDRDKIINFERVNYIQISKVDKNKSVIEINYADCNWQMIAEYKTEERAKEVLRKIVNRYADVSMSNVIENLGITIHDRDFGGNARSVYEMPED